MNISFDFDNTLDNPEIQKVAEHFINSGNKVFIITTRFDSRLNNDLLLIANKLGINSFNIIFTNGNSKVKALLDNKIDIHFEDCLFEVKEIERSKNLNTTVVHVTPFIKGLKSFD